MPLERLEQNYEAVGTAIAIEETNSLPFNTLQYLLESSIWRRLTGTNFERKFGTDHEMILMAQLITSNEDTFGWAVSATYVIRLKRKGLVSVETTCIFVIHNVQYKCTYEISRCEPLMHIVPNITPLLVTFV